MFSALQAAGLTLKPTKLQFGQEEIEHLGHVISEKGISISADRIKAILALPEPECIKDNRGFLGTCLLYTSPSPRDLSTSRMPSSA